MMKRQSTLMILAALLMMLCSASAMASDRHPNEMPVDPPTNVTEEDDDPEYVVVEQMPQYPGGSAAMMKFIIENLNYPKQLVKKRVEGRVVISFVIDKKGNVTKAHVVRSIHPALDKEALRVVNKMPRWTPGKKDGKPVNVKYTIPISFKAD